MLSYGKASQHGAGSRCFHCAAACAGVDGERDGGTIRTFRQNWWLHQLLSALGPSRQSPWCDLDPAEWFWGIRRWLRYLVETVPIAYTWERSLGRLRHWFGLVSAANLNGTAWIRILQNALWNFCRTVIPELVCTDLVVARHRALPGIGGYIVIHTTECWKIVH
ncbi:MAG: hypothetical protein U1E15_04395 [Hyphomicrobiales bacterium]